MALVNSILEEAGKFNYFSHLTFIEHMHSIVGHLDCAKESSRAGPQNQEKTSGKNSDQRLN